MLAITKKYHPIPLQELVGYEPDSGLFHTEKVVLHTLTCESEHHWFPLRCMYDCIIDLEVQSTNVMENVSIEYGDTVICSRKNTKHAVFTELTDPTPLITSFFNNFLLVITSVDYKDNNVSIKYKDCLFNETLRQSYNSENAVIVTINNEATLMTYEKRSLMAAWNDNQANKQMISQ